MLMLFLLAAAALVLSAASVRSPASLVRSLFAGPVDGDWTAIAIDGRKVDAERFRIAVSDGQVVGGRDDCDDWSYESGRDRNGQRMIVSTLVACPDSELRRAFAAIVARPALESRPDGTLRASGNGHHAILLRCRWKNVHSVLPGGGTSDVMRCLPRT